MNIHNREGKNQVQVSLLSSKVITVSIPNLENELCTFSSIKYIGYIVYFFEQNSEVIYLVFVEHLCIKNKEMQRRGKEQTCGFR